MRHDLIHRLRAAGPRVMVGAAVIIPDGWYECALGFVRAVEMERGRRRVSCLTLRKGAFHATLKRGAGWTDGLRASLRAARIDSLMSCLVCGEATRSLRGRWCRKHLPQ